MRYYDINEFAAIIHVAPITLYKRADTPEFDKMTKGEGRPRQLWSETTVNRYRLATLNRLKASMKELKDIKKAARACKIGENQAVGLWEERPAAVEKKVNLQSGFDIFLNISSNLRSKLNGE
jgi:hypothetical protein